MLFPHFHLIVSADICSALLYYLFTNDTIILRCITTFTPYSTTAEHRFKDLAFLAANLLWLAYKTDLHTYNLHTKMHFGFIHLVILQFIVFASYVLHSAHPHTRLDSVMLQFIVFASYVLHSAHPHTRLDSVMLQFIVFASYVLHSARPHTRLEFIL